MKRILFAPLLLWTSAVQAADALAVFGRQWTVPAAADWRLGGEGGAATLHLVTGREPPPGPRRPVQFALTEIPRYDELTVEADVKPLGRSLIIVFAYRDAAHFDYVHLSIDAGTGVPAHNGVFHVYGGERVRISRPEGPPAFPRNNHWYHAKLTHDARSGAIAVTVDGRAVPALGAVDVSLGPGQVGLGSFDETAEFRNVEITTR
ncbi:MAG TPA: hypothetical protein VFA75_13825 [Nevskia sp.]|nr:hypothetical protein [Nevskia sp.]